MPLPGDVPKCVSRLPSPAPQPLFSHLSLVLSLLPPAALLTPPVPRVPALLALLPTHLAICLPIQKTGGGRKIPSIRFRFLLRVLLSSSHGARAGAKTRPDEVVSIFRSSRKLSCFADNSLVTESVRFIKSRLLESTSSLFQAPWICLSSGYRKGLPSPYCCLFFPPPFFGAAGQCFS